MRVYTVRNANGKIMTFVLYIFNTSALAIIRTALYIRMPEERDAMTEYTYSTNRVGCEVTKTRPIRAIQLSCYYAHDRHSIQYHKAINFESPAILNLGSRPPLQRFQFQGNTQHTSLPRTLNNTTT